MAKLNKKKKKSQKKGGPPVPKAQYEDNKPPLLQVNRMLSPQRYEDFKSDESEGKSEFEYKQPQSSNNSPDNIQKIESRYFLQI